jgi:hypothetical protein
MSEPSQPSHLIRRREVAAWLAESVVREITVHRTSAEAAARIIRDGVRIERSAREVRWGQGFYTSNRPDLQYGDTSVAVAVRLRRPFVAEDSIEGQERIDEMLAEAGSDDVRAVPQAAGYDGVVVHFPDGEAWVVAFADDQVKVIRG